MCIVRLTRIVCDSCSTMGIETDLKPRPARNELKALGWKMGKKKDYCPACKDSIKAEEPVSVVM